MFKLILCTVYVHSEKLKTCPGYISMLHIYRRPVLSFTVFHVEKGTKLVDDSIIQKHYGYVQNAEGVEGTKTVPNL